MVSITGNLEFQGKIYMCVGNTYSKHKSLNRYAMMAKGQDETRVMSIIDPVLVK